MTAGYVRLSVKDLKHEGDSIETQKRIILNHIDNHPELQLSEFYIDDGVSGTTYDRAAFNKMMEDMEKGKIGCIVVKDITRFGRNMIDTGYYTTQYFPSKGIRFISVNDDFDSARDDVELIFTIKSLFSEYYATDIGNKVRSVIKNQMERGKFVGSRPPFGYVKAPRDCHQLVVDKPAADVVKQIFEWAEKGDSISEIVRSLNDLKIATPSHYWLQAGIIKNENMAGDGRWQARTVSKILFNEVYVGKLVQGKTKIANNKQRSASLDNLIEVENAHEAIISTELFSKVQEILCRKAIKRASSNKSQNEPYTTNLFAGRIFCAYCGSPLNRKKSHQTYIYRCTVNYSAPGQCIGNSIKEDTLKKAISEQIIQHMEALSDDNSPDTELVQHELKMIQAELSNKDALVPILFESLHNGDISEDEFREMKSKHQQKIDRLEKRREQLTLQYEEQEAARKNWLELKSALCKFSQTKELTQYLVDKLLISIVIHKDGKVLLEFKMSD